MKADSGSWLYILLSIVFLVLSAVGNRNKKKATTSTQPVNDEDDYEPSPSERNWPKSLDDVLNEVLDLPKKPEVVTTNPQPWSRDTILEKSYGSYERIEEEAKSLETIEAETFSYDSPEEIKRGYSPIIVAPEKVEKVEEHEPVLVLSDFDLRQGIIYAEILNRKYF